jgi:hypothetical protein
MVIFYESFQDGHQNPLVIFFWGTSFLEMSTDRESDSSI